MVAELVCRLLLGNASWASPPPRADDTDDKVDNSASQRDNGPLRAKPAGHRAEYALDGRRTIELGDQHIP